MAKKTYTYPFKSRFGSHSNMVLSDNGELCICKDEYGKYLTTLSRIDNGLADPARYDLVKRKIDIRQASRSLS